MMRRLQGFKASRLQGFKASRLQGFKASRLQGFALKGATNANAPLSLSTDLLNEDNTTLQALSKNDRTTYSPSLTYWPSLTYSPSLT
jgi:hypothetical protein